MGCGRAGLLAACALLFAGACTKPLEFGTRGTGGMTMVNTGDGSADAPRPGVGGGNGTGGVTGLGGSNGTGGVIGTGGVVGNGGTGGPIDARMDLPRDVPPDVRDTGPDIRDTGPDTNGPVVCTVNTDCSGRQAGLVCFIQAGQPGRCVECVTNECASRSTTAKVCDSMTNRCVECVNAASDCSTTSSEHGPQCSTNHHCLNGCSDDNGPPVCPAATPTCITGSMGSGPDICVACTTNAQCGTGGTCLAPGVCVTCQGDANCTAVPGKPICDVAFTGNCVQCRDSRDCPGHQLCDPLLLTCKSVP
jgi:hypothetical protein